MILRSQGTTELAILESELLIHNRLCLSHSVRLEESEADPFPRGPIVEYEHQVSSRTEFTMYGVQLVRWDEDQLIQLFF